MHPGGFKADYERSENVRALWDRAPVAPNHTFIFDWSCNDNSFWYRRRRGPGRGTFVQVIPEKSLCQPAFDHERLAKALNDRGIKAQADDLPFNDIILGSLGKSVRFRLLSDKRRTWKFKEDGYLGIDDGNVSDDSEEEAPNAEAVQLTPLGEEEASHPRLTRPNLVPFVNYTMEPLCLSKLDGNGEPRSLEDLTAGNFKEVPTHCGQVWRVTRSSTQDLVASFLIPKGPAIVIITEKMLIASEGPFKLTKAYRTYLSPEPSTPEELNPEEKLQRIRLLVEDWNISMIDVQGHRTILSADGTSESYFETNFDRSSNGRFVVICQSGSIAAAKIQQQSKSHDLGSPRKRQRSDSDSDTKIMLPLSRMRMFDLVEKKEVIQKGFMCDPSLRIKRLGWNASSDEYRFLHVEREPRNGILQIVGLDIEGKSRVITKDIGGAFLDDHHEKSHHVLLDSNEMVWGRIIGGQYHLYLYDMKMGQLKRQLTRGEWTVDEIDHVDEAKRSVCFSAYGLVKEQDPYFKHLARVSLDGSDMTILTAGDGDHMWEWSPNRRWLIDSWSRVDLAHKVAVCDGKTGEHLITFEQGDINLLTEVGLSVPERFATTSTDGCTLVHGIIVRPFNLDPAKKCPVIQTIDQDINDYFTQKCFTKLSRMRELAELGFVLVAIDARRPIWIPEVACDDDDGEVATDRLRDHIAWIRAAAQSRPWIDVDNVGILGDGTGGRYALAAIFYHGNFYKAAVADASELWEQTPEYPDLGLSNPVARVGWLKAMGNGQLGGALMLVVREKCFLRGGEWHEVVQMPALTKHVIDGLNRRGKVYDLVLLPHDRRSAAQRNIPGATTHHDEELASRKKKDFFVRNLHSTQLPNRNSGSNSKAGGC